MKEKTRRILIMAVMAALIITLMAASLCYTFTSGRYVGGKLDNDTTYDDHFDFTGASAFEVRTPDEFVNAVENGYSYIKIADNAEEPFVINNDIADVYTNLVLDVNGTTVIRNSRNPVLDVRRSISVVLVYDSSVEGSGGFYNPVGSALQTSGGSLTVGSGVYESGPNSSVNADLPTSEAVSLVTRTERTSTEYGTASSSKLPILTKSGGDKTKSGDKYLPENWTDTVSGDQINPDTYLLYTEVQNAFVGSGQTADGTIPDASAPADPDNPVVFQSGQLYINCEKFTVEGENNTKTTTYSADIFSPVSNVASCDFYYYYPIDNDAYSTTAGSPAAPKTYAVVYGYNDVKGLAEDSTDDSTDDTTAVDLREKGLVWPYAAIRSVRDGTVGGNTHARGGAFTTNFGTDNTYGILSVGGEMTVGTESATAPPTFTAVGEGTCIGMSAQTGDTLTIASGTFSSEVGDTILMRGGEMTVTGGRFTKSGNKARPSDGLEAIEASRTALIHMLGGELTIDGTVTRESDSMTYSVNMTAESPNNTPLTNVFGIYSAEDDTSGRATAGTVSVSGCKITVNGTYSAGILSSAGTVNVGGTENGKADTDITVTNSIESNQLLTSSAVSSEGGEVNLNSTVNISSDSLGITARGEVNVMSGTTKVNTPNATGVYVNSGTLTVKNNATLTVDSAISNASYSWVTPPGTSEPTNAPNIYNGVYVQNGSLTSNGTLNVTFTGVQSDPSTLSSNDDTAFRTFQVKSYAVRVEGTDTATSTVTIAKGKITNSVGGGVLVSKGNVTLGDTDTEEISLEVELSGDKYQTNADGTATQYDCNEKDGNWSYTPPTTGGDAVKIDGGTLIVDGGKYTAAYGNGILVSDGKATVNGGTFKGQDPRRIDGGFYTGAGSNYGLKVLGGYAIVNGGTFIDWTLNESEERVSGGGGGMFIMGENANTPQTQIISATIDVTGATAVSVWEYANVEFGVTNTDNTDKINSQLIVRGASTGLAVETTSTEGRQDITINSGKFTGNTSGGAQNGIWYGNRATMTINGGEFTGGTSGLFFAENQWENNVNYVQISGGTFIGTPGKRALDWGIAYWQNGAIGAASSGVGDGDGVGADMRIQDFIDCYSGKSIYYYNDRNGADLASSTALSVYINGSRDTQRINRTTCQYYRVEIK